MGWVEKVNMAVAKSVVGKRFRLEFSGHRKERKGSRFLTEIRAGLATFFAMAYIISVNASIVSSSGGTCVCAPNADFADDPFCFKPSNPSYLEYEMCKQEIRRDLVTATAAIAALSSFCLGLFANMPISLAPGMGLNAYFTFQVVGANGSGPVPYRLALTAVFIEGLIFVALSILGLRQWLARAIPASLKIASGVGIGLFLTIIGLTYNAGLGVILGGTSDPLTLAGCTPANRADPELFPELNQTCVRQKMRNPTMWIGIFCGGIFTAILMMYRVKGAIIAGILLVSAISWPRGTVVTYFPDTPLGDSSFDFFKNVVGFHAIKRTLNELDWNISGANGGSFALALITFLYVDILDCTGTLYSMARFCGAIDEETQDFEGSAVAYIVDASSISIGALFGSPPVTAFIESGAGISEGGATGLTAMFTGLFFFISIFFAPIFASIPPWATGCTLILVGAMMARACTDINWRYIGDSIPAFITLAIMPFTYSIAYGLIAGIFTYTILNTFCWVLIKVSGGRFTPHDYDQKDYWSYKIKGGIIPGWVKRAAKGKKDFWRSEEDSAHAAEQEYYEKRSGSANDRPYDGANQHDAAITGDKNWEADGKSQPHAYNTDIGIGEARDVPVDRR